MNTIYYGGTILTMDQAQYADAVLTEDGCIRGIGNLSELEQLAPDANRINLEGATLMPAFIDPHSHFSNVATALLQVPLDGADSWDVIAARLKAFAAENRVPGGQWVTAKGYDHNRLKELAHPPLALLDAALPDHPLVIQHQSGHVGIFNSRGLKALGITAETAAPEGGYIEKKDGQLTGYMEENAFFSNLRKVPMPDAADLLRAFSAAQQKYSSHGIATIQEGMMVKELIPLYQMLQQKQLLKLDVVGYPELASLDQWCQAFPEAVKRYQGHVKLGGIKIFLDGSPQSRTAWMRTPYEGETEYCGYGVMKDDDVLDALHTARKHNLQILAHCNGDAAAAQYLRAIEKMKQAGHDMADLRPVMIHAQLLGLDQIADLQALGVIPSFFIAHVYHWGDTHIRNFGMKRASTISPAASALQAEIPFTFHQDAPVIEPDMLETVWCAANRITRGGVLLGGTERISVLDALKAVTANSAYQYFEENSKGTISRGKAADFVILDQNPLLMEKESIRDIQVLATIKGSRPLYQKDRAYPQGLERS